MTSRPNESKSSVVTAAALRQPQRYHGSHGVGGERGLEITYAKQNRRDDVAVTPTEEPATT